MLSEERERRSGRRTRAISPRAKLQAALMLNGPRAIPRAMLTFHAHVRRGFASARDPDNGRNESE
jgi:hypothetical protein